MRTTLRRLKQGRVIEHTLPQEDTIAVQDPPKSRPRLPCCGPCRLPSVESGAPNRICDKDDGSLSVTGWLALKPHPPVHPQTGEGRRIPHVQWLPESQDFGVSVAVGNPESLFPLCESPASRGERHKVEPHVGLPPVEAGCCKRPGCRAGTGQQPLLRI